MNIGLFGGTFNPPHLGHLIVAESVRESLHLDKVLFMPTAVSPHKGLQWLAPGEDRLHMTRLAAGDQQSFEVSDLEIIRGGYSYTVDTLDELAVKYPGARLKLLIGADNLFDFEEWKSPDEILLKADLIVMSRPGFDPRKARAALVSRAACVTVPPIGISGTDIRRRVKFGQSIRFLVPREVENYIYARHLYR